MRLKQKQKGLSTLGWLVAISMFGGLIFIGVKLAPHYAENQYFIQSLRNLGEVPGGIESLSTTEIRGQLSRFFVVNGVRSKGANDVEVERLNDRVLVKINYEVRVPLFYNIDAMLTFNNVLDSKFPGECCKPRAEKQD